jgi:hypothetical protein
MYNKLMIVLDPLTHTLTIYAIFHTGLVAGADMVALAKRVKKRRAKQKTIKADKKPSHNVHIQDGMIP